MLYGYHTIREINILVLFCRLTLQCILSVHFLNPCFKDDFGLGLKLTITLLPVAVFNPPFHLHLTSRLINLLKKELLTLFFIYLFIYLSIYLFIYSFIFIYLLIYLFIIYFYLFIYLFIYLLNNSLFVLFCFSFF